MKQNIQVAGSIELNEEDIKTMLLNYAKGNEQLLLKAIDDQLKKQHGISVKQIIPINNESSELTLKIEVQTVAAGKLSISKLKAQAGGFIKPNMGFYWELSKYIEGLKRKRKKSIEYTIVLKAMKKLFPALTEKQFYVYIIDKRQWIKRGFSFDSKSKTFNF